MEVLIVVFERAYVLKAMGLYFANTGKQRRASENLKTIHWTTTILARRRAVAKPRLDSESDFIVVGGKVCFRQSFEAIEGDETFCRAPESVIDAGKHFLELDAGNGISRLVHDTVVVKIGCNNVSLFAMVSGGRGHT